MKTAAVEMQTDLVQLVLFQLGFVCDGSWSWSWTWSSVLLLLVFLLLHTIHLLVLIFSPPPLVRLHFLLLLLHWQDDSGRCAAHRHPQGALLPAGGWFGTGSRALRGRPGVCCRVPSGGGREAWADILHSGWSDTLRSKMLGLWLAFLDNSELIFFLHLVRK